jgi:hypothetical protein
MKYFNSRFSFLKIFTKVTADECKLLTYESDLRSTQIISERDLGVVFVLAREFIASLLNKFNDIIGRVLPMLPLQSDFLESLIDLVLDQGVHAVSSLLLDLAFNLELIADVLELVGDPSEDFVVCVVGLDLFLED